MYDAVGDPYCYRGTRVLRNKLGILDAEQLEAFEEEISKTRAEQPLPSGRLTVTHYRALHRHLFQDVYGWAGQIRTVRIAKGGSMFAYPEHVSVGLRTAFAELRRVNHLRGLSRAAFAPQAAHFLAELNALHPFRDGNGRTQVVFLALLADQAGHPLTLTRLDPSRFLSAMIASFRGDETLLAMQIEQLTGRED